MDDFRNLNENGITRLPREASLTPVPNEYGGIYDKPKAPKLGFIQTRINKDNFWNLMFAAGMIVGSLTVGAIPSLIIMAIILRKFNKVTFTPEKTFLNNNGQNIGTRTPRNLLWVIALTIGVTILITGAIGNIAQTLPKSFTMFLGFSTIFFTFTSYFILTNCPISVLFNLSFWKQNSDFNYQPSYKSSSFSDELYYSPSYRHCSGNTYNRR